MNVLDKITCALGFHDWSNLVSEQPMFRFASNEDLYSPARVVSYEQHYLCMCGEELSKVDRRVVYRQEGKTDEE